MVRGSSQSQASSSVTSRPSTVGMAPRGSAAATAGMRRRRLGTGSAGGGSGGFGSGSSGSNMLRFYTDDAPGLKITPTVVLVMSLCFIGFVTALHVFGKIYRHRSGGVAWSRISSTSSLTLWHVLVFWFCSPTVVYRLVLIFAPLVFLISPNRTVWKILEGFMIDYVSDVKAENCSNFGFCILQYLDISFLNQKLMTGFLVLHTWPPSDG